MSPLPFALLATLLLGVGLLLLELTKQTKGRGSWRKDNELKIIAGGCFGLALVALAWGVQDSTTLSELRAVLHLELTV